MTTPAFHTDPTTGIQYGWDGQQWQPLAVYLEEVLGESQQSADADPHRARRPAHLRGAGALPCVTSGCDADGSETSARPATPSIAPSVAGRFGRPTYHRALTWAL